MAIPSTHCEAKKHGYRQTQDGIVVSFVLHPNEVPDDLALAALGTRYMLAFARIGDDETPEVPEAKRPTPPFSDLPRSQQAGIYCNDVSFQKWAGRGMSEPSARQFVIDNCDINSRRELDRSVVAGRSWDSLRADFETATGRAAEARG